MAKTPSTDKLTETVLSLPFEEKVKIYEALKASITAEAISRKETGQMADKVLQNLNGKA
jgi:hypothetical protein